MNIFIFGSEVGQMIANHEVIDYYCFGKHTTYVEYVVNSKIDNNFRKRAESKILPSIN